MKRCIYILHNIYILYIYIYIYTHTHTHTHTHTLIYKVFVCVWSPRWILKLQWDDIEALQNG